VEGTDRELSKDGEQFQRIGEAVTAAACAQDGYTIAEHPDLDALNLELNNLSVQHT
jgi:hypothetical protein